MRGQAPADHARLDASIEAFEYLFCGNMVLVLDHYFVRRTRALEGKGGNPLNEVRMLCGSLMHHNSVMAADKTIKYDPAKAVLKYAVGGEIEMNEPGFARLSVAFFADMEREFT